MRRRSYDDMFEHKGRQFGLTIEHDDQMGPPWKEHDGHGIVSEWTSRAKHAGERVLAQDRGSYRYYDFAKTIQIATKDGWGPCDAKEGETKKQRIARAVEQDFEYLRAWCNDEWHWCGIIVELLDSDENGTGETESLWGMEDSNTEYVRSEAHELADEILHRVYAEYAEAVEASRPDLYQGNES